MPQIKKVRPLKDTMLYKIGYTWFKDIDGEYIIKDKMIEITKDEAEAYYKAANTLYTMYEVGAEHVINNNLFNELDIPPNMISYIKKSWKYERENHLYGRFDFSGGIDGIPIKLIEFNADTPTLLLETSVIQWMLLQYNDLNNYQQFNNVYQAITKKFKILLGNKKGNFTRLLFSSINNNEEEINTTRLLQMIANDAGGVTNFSYLKDTFFNDGIVLDVYDNKYDYWFKLYPWEDIAESEPDLLKLLNTTNSKIKTHTLNPAYTLLYQSKGMLKILYDLYPNSPYLLKTSYSPLKEKYVKKNTFGREGANIDIVDTNGSILHSTSGIYSKYKSIYQAYASYPKDKNLNFYQAGVFFSDEACGISFRMGSEILDDMSKFIGHVIKTQ